MTHRTRIFRRRGGWRGGWVAGQLRKNMKQVTNPMHTTRRQFIRRALGGGAAAFVAHHLRGACTLAAEVPPSAPAGAAGRPDILFILPDQQRYDAMGVVNSAARTPNLDRLAGEGVRFDLAYVAQALCTPSRGAIFSGLYPHTNGLQDNIYNVPDALADPKYKLSVTWPRLLQQAGYKTGYIGKWHLGEKPPGCFDEWIGYNSLKPHWLGKRDQSEYRSDVETGQAIDFIKRHAGKPFALCVGYYPPHTPYDPPKKYEELYQGSPLKPPAYWGAVTAIDACVGRLMKGLDDAGLRGRTLVVFTADHGDHFGKRPGGSNKQNGYDEAARVPLIFRLPGVFEGGAVRTDLVSLVDLMPTILEVAGVKAPQALEGMSLIGHGGAEPKPRTAVIIENHEVPAKKGLPVTSRCVRTDRYKLILRDSLPVRGQLLRELYDCKADPLEHANIYGPRQADVIARLLDELDAWAQKTGDADGLALSKQCRDSLKAPADKPVS
jgi:arylsulfatase A-like enzyme